MILFLGKEGFLYNFLNSKLQRDRVTKVYIERRTVVRLFFLADKFVVYNKSSRRAKYW